MWICKHLILRVVDAYSMRYDGERPLKFQHGHMSRESQDAVLTELFECGLFLSILQDERKYIFYEHKKLFFKKDFLQTTGCVT